MNPRNLAAHVEVTRYGEFVLTDAIRPSMDLQVIPQQGYRLDFFREPQSGQRIPVLVAAVTKRKLFETFLNLLEPLGEVVDVVLETSHDSKSGAHKDLHREQIDLPVLLSYCYEFEDLLLNDGCTGVAVISSSMSMEVQFDEHKLLVVYAQELRPFQRILAAAGIRREDGLKLITEGEHLHSTEPRFQEQFEQLSYRLGVGVEAEQLSW